MLTKLNFGKRLMVVSAVLWIMVMIVSGCSSQTASKDSSNEKTTSSTPPEKVSLRLDWLVNGYSTPFILAKEKGLYSKVGLDVSIGPGKGSGVTAQTVGSGADTFGLADASMISSAITQGVPVKYIAVYLQKSPASIIYRADTKIEKPQDLIGKTGGFAQTDANLALFRAALGTSNIPLDKVPLSMMDAPTKIPALLQKKIDFIGGFSIGDYLRAKSQDPTMKIINLPDWNVNALSIGLIVSTDTLKNKPEMVKKFVEATTEGWKLAKENPEEAVDAAIKVFPDSDRQLLLEGLKGTFDTLQTKRSEGKTIGWIAKEDFDDTLSVMSKYGGLQNPKPVETYFTNDFLPYK